MSSRTLITTSTGSYSDELQALGQALAYCEAFVVGAGAGLSSSAGLDYEGERFDRHFFDFRKAYSISDMYSGGFYPFPSPEVRWAWWSRQVWLNRYSPAPKNTYEELLAILKGKDFFVLTTNVDHRFQVAGIDKDRLFYTQGDYGLFQCSQPCHARTYDNVTEVRAMLESQGIEIASDLSLRLPQDLSMAIDPDLIPRCPRCGREMMMNLRSDRRFVEDAGWHAAQSRYLDFLAAHDSGPVLYWELGVGQNTPVIIKFPFWEACQANPRARYCCLNRGQAYAPKSIAQQSILLNADIGHALKDLQTLPA